MMLRQSASLLRRGFSKKAETQQYILTSVVKNVGVIELNRPKVINSIDSKHMND